MGHVCWHFQASKLSQMVDALAHPTSSATHPRDQQQSTTRPAYETGGAENRAYPQACREQQRCRSQALCDIDHSVSVIKPPLQVIANLGQLGTLCCCFQLQLLATFGPRGSLSVHSRDDSCSRSFASSVRVACKRRLRPRILRDRITSDTTQIPTTTPVTASAAARRCVSQNARMMVIPTKKIPIPADSKATEPQAKRAVARSISSWTSVVSSSRRVCAMANSVARSLLNERNKPV